MSALARSDPGKSTASIKPRAAWKKKSATEIIVAETEKLRQRIIDRENELKEWRIQLEKFEEARKIFEA